MRQEIFMKTILMLMALMLCFCGSGGKDSDDAGEEDGPADMAGDPDADPAADADMLQDPVLREIGWGPDSLVLVRGLVGDEAADGDTAR